jgi:hypothetical protein
VPLKSTIKTAETAFLEWCAADSTTPLCNNRVNRQNVLVIVWNKGWEKGAVEMLANKVALFRPYPFQVGEKIRIEGGPRRGDWEVIGISEGKIRLRCPVSFREFEWDRFCYLVDEREEIEWPQHDK